MSKKKNQIRIKIIPCFCQFLIFELRGRGHEPNLSQAENPSAEAWLEPAWLGLITTILPGVKSIHKIQQFP